MKESFSYRREQFYARDNVCNTQDKKKFGMCIKKELKGEMLLNVMRRIF